MPYNNDDAIKLVERPNQDDNHIGSYYVPVLDRGLRDDTLASVQFLE